MLFRLRSRRFIRPACKEPRQLHRAIDGFRAAIVEEDAIETGPGSEFARERALVRVVIEIREMNRTVGFAADYFHDSRMCVTEGVDSDAAEKIEILLPGGVKNIRAAPVRHDYGRPFVGGQEKLFGIQQTYVLLDGSHARSPGLGGRPRDGSFSWRGAHHAAERAAREAESGSRKTRVPGIDATPSFSIAPVACDASSNAWE